MKAKSCCDAKWFDLFILAATILCFGIIGFRAAQDLVSALVNCAVLLCMAIFLLVGLGYLFTKTGAIHLQSCTNDLRRLTDGLNQGAAWQQIIDHPDCPFESEALKQALEEMNKASDALYVGTQSYYRCDVADYVNQDLLQEIGNAGFNDFVSNVMTGLGILGTFVGLAIGLQSFHTESAEAMTNSIAPLIEGIKVAFYTSIFGVALSLIYGTLYRRRMAQANQALADFTSAFYRHVSQRSENEAISRLLQFQESQTQSMSQFAEEFSMALANVLEQSPVLASLPQKLSEAMAKSMIPTMESIQMSFEHTAQNLTQNLAAAQSDGVGEIVTQFVGQMNGLMGDQMEQLRTSIQAICTFQETAIAKLHEALSGICANSANLEGLNHSLADTVARLEQYVRNMETLQETQSARIETTISAISACSDHIRSAVDGMAEAAQESTQMAKDISDMAERVQQQEKELQKLSNSQKRTLEESLATLRAQVETMQKSYGAMTKGFDQVSNKMLSASDRLGKQMDTAMERSYAQFDQQLATALEHFSGTLSQLRELLERMPQAVNGTASKMHQQQVEFSQKMRQSVDELTDQLKALRGARK